ncbi:MAG: DUF3365 domain-containing protein [Novosphingobium sp.]
MPASSRILPFRPIRSDWFRPAVLGLGALAAAACSGNSGKIDEGAVLRQSVPVADAFQAELKQALGGALKQGGPLLAIGVCQEAAPAIAQAQSAASGAEVRRIAERTRNPAAAIPAELAGAYAELAANPVVQGKPAEQIVRTGTGNAARIHYLRAIPMQAEPCAACHGTAVKPEVKAAIVRSYPQDRATGFSPGEMRGALLVSWPAEKFRP